MNGPQHYLAGEKLLADAELIPSNNDETNPAATLLTAQATAHFLAAKVALSAFCQPVCEATEDGSGHPSQDHYEEWVEAIEIGPQDYEGVAFGGTTDPSIVSQQNAENSL